MAAGPAHLQAGAEKFNLTLLHNLVLSVSCVQGGPRTQTPQDFPEVGNCSKERQAKVRS